MDSWVIAMMLGVSIFLGSIALVAFLWGIKSGQFDDEQKEQLFGYEPNKELKLDESGDVNE